MNTHPLLGKTIAILADLIRFQSVSSQSNLDLIEYIRNYVKHSNARVEITRDKVENKANILISLPDKNGSVDGGVLLSGHTDVVPVEGQDWHTNPFELVQKDERLYGRGSCDMKGFIAACLALFSEYDALDRAQALHMAFSYDEEVGCLGAEVLVDAMRKHNIVPNVAMIGEPTDMKVVVGHKGCFDYTTHLKGLAGHGSLPHLGVSALEYGVCYAHKLMSMQKYLESNAPSNSQFQPKHSTLIVSGMRGGIAHNVIADSCSIDWQLRPVQHSDTVYVHDTIDEYAESELLPKMKSVYSQSSIKKEVLSEVVGLQPVDDSEGQALLAKLTGDRSLNFVSYGTEAGIFQGLGTSCVVCGPGSIEQAHKADEFVSVEQMNLCLEVLTRLKEELV